MPIRQFFSQLFSSRHDEDDTVGMLWISIWPKDSAMVAYDFNQTISNTLIPKFLATEGVLHVWQVKNNSPSARGGTVYNNNRPERGGPYSLFVPHTNIKAVDWTKAIYSKEKENIFGAELRAYRLVQRFEGRHKHGQGHCLVAILIDPADGQTEDIDLWYRTENLRMMADTPMHIRSRRYERMTGSDEGADDTAPRMLCVHEFTSSKALLDHAIRYERIVEKTPWSEKIFANVKSSERTVWDITEKHMPKGRIASRRAGIS
ncbi:Hypothetical protein R9X50_00104900 [Acrodontium crateriforme]|uniref:Uncharacterized protein n=1 Tax=Acrodontium crateriforme TaxID=150365 RepID=A0AAQ3M4D2_9PEZI|nr:Hypothetical protein R9X50_00104900 [Acrodontium crateriforme]